MRYRIVDLLFIGSLLIIVAVSSYILGWYTTSTPSCAEVEYVKGTTTLEVKPNYGEQKTINGFYLQPAEGFDIKEFEEITL